MLSNSIGPILALYAVYQAGNDFINALNAAPSVWIIGIFVESYIYFIKTQVGKSSKHVFKSRIILALDQGYRIWYQKSCCKNQHG